MKRRTVLAGGAALALVGLAPARAAAPDPVSGKLSIWLGYGETAPAYRLALPAFKEMYPNIQVEILTFDLHEYEAKLAVAVPTGNGPDLLTLHDYIFPHYYENNSLDAMPADLAAVVNNPEDRRSGFRQDRLARRQAVGCALVEGQPGAVLQPRSFQGSRPVRPAQDNEGDVGIRREADEEGPGRHPHPRRHHAPPHRRLRRSAEIQRHVLRDDRRAGAGTRPQARHRAGDAEGQSRRRGAVAARLRRTSARPQEGRRLGAQA